jgi:hypothetical protein
MCYNLKVHTLLAPKTQTRRLALLQHPTGSPRACRASNALEQVPAAAAPLPCRTCMASTGCVDASDRIALPLCTSQILIVESSLPLNGMPFVSSPTHVTAPSWPRSVRLHTAPGSSSRGVVAPARPEPQGTAPESGRPSHAPGHTGQTKRLHTRAYRALSMPRQMRECPPDVPAAAAQHTAVQCTYLQRRSSMPHSLTMLDVSPLTISSSSKATDITRAVWPCVEGQQQLQESGARRASGEP